MTGYVRNDVTDQIANGNTVDAIPLDGEFNAIQAAFAAVGGHAHTGAVGEGAPITVIGPAQDLVASANSLTPKTDNTVDLGSSALEFKDLWVDGTANIDSLVADAGTVGGVAITTESNTQTLTNKTVNLANNTLVATSAQLRTAVTDETGTGALVFADSPALAGTPTAPTAAAGTNTTQVATTAHVFAERSNTATLTNKTLTSPTINGGSISGITDLAVADGGTGVSTITGIVRGNGTSPFSAAVAGTDFLSPADIGTTVQAFDADLSAIAGLSTNGLIARNGAGTAVTRTLTAGGGISITNGDGVAGNPVIAAFDPENRIINGAFDFWQRGTSSTAGGYVAADRWINVIGGGTVTMSRQAFAVGDTLGSNSPAFYLRQTVSGQTLASHNAQVQHRIEGVRSYAGQTITVLGWARRISGSGNISLEAFQNFGTGGSPSAPTQGVGQIITLTNSFAPFAVTINVPSITSRVLGTNGDDYLGLIFWTSAGADFNSRSGSLGLQTIGVDLWGIHIRLGTHTTAAVDLYRAPELGPEEARCQRYFQSRRFVLASTAFGGSSGGALAQLSLPTVMRAPPSVVLTPDSGTGGVVVAMGAGAIRQNVLHSVVTESTVALDAEL